jgi:hypothetical protein
MELEFGFYAPGDEEQILTLFHQNFPKIPRDRADWQWEYEQNPFGTPIIALAKDGAKVVGQEAFYCVPMKAGEQPVAGAQSIDTMTDAAYRGQGIFKRLALMTLTVGQERQLSLFYGFPNKNSYNGYVKRFGWTDVGRIPRWVKVLDLGSALRARWKSPLLCRLVGTLALPLLRFYFRGRVPRNTNFQLERVIRFGPETDALWQGLRSRFAFAVERNSQYLNWRYIDHPSAGYQGFFLKQGSRICGFAVLRLADLEYRLGSIGELFVEQWDPKMASIFLALLLDQLRGQKAAIVATWTLPHSPLISALRNNGFRLRSTHQPLIAISPDGSIPGERLARLEDWYITSGDYDMY